jgi:WD40 repeat protein
MKASIWSIVASITLVAAGFTLARLFPPGVAAQAPPDKPLASALVRAKDAVPTRGDWGEWRRYFRGKTHGTKDMIVLMVTLKPGQAPHPPHRHAEEEFMILAEGNGTWHLDGKEWPARKGDVVYAAPWTMHGLENTGDVALTYYMVKWSSKGVPAPENPSEKAPAPQNKKEKDRLDGVTLLEELTAFDYPGRVYAVAFAPDSKSVAAGGQGGRVKLWDVTTTKELAEFRQADWIRSLAFSPDGKTLAAGSENRYVRHWDLATGKVIVTVKGLAVAFSRDGKQFATGGQDGTLRVFDAGTRKELSSYKSGPGKTWSVAFSPDGKLLAAGGKGGTVKLWNLETAKEVASLNAHAKVVWSIAFAPDGKTLASGGGEDAKASEAKLWDVATGMLRLSLKGHKSMVTSVAFMPDGQMLASGDDAGCIKLWETSTGKELGSLVAFTGGGGACSLAFSPDGKTLAAGSDDGTIKLWTVAAKPPQAGNPKARGTLIRQQRRHHQVVGRDDWKGTRHPRDASKATARCLQGLCFQPGQQASCVGQFSERRDRVVGRSRSASMR